MAHDSTPRIFISYTARDLAKYADAVVKAVRRLGMQPVDHQDFTATGNPSLEECIRSVEGSDALIVLVAHRYGWIPSRQEGGDGERSVTWLEVEAARAAGITVLPFLIHEDAPWPPSQIEGYHDPVAKNSLERFKAILNRTLRARFSTPDDLAFAATAALSVWRDRARSEPSVAVSSSDPITEYRRRLEESTRRVELIGFGEQFRTRLPIDQLYVSLRVHVPREFQRSDATGGPKAIECAERVLRDVRVEDAFVRAIEFDQRGVVLLGDPGCGKTTVARRVAWAAADLAQGSESLGLPAGVVPVLLPLRRIRSDAMPTGLEDLLTQVTSSIQLADSQDLPARLLACPRLLWILDGLDEVADEGIRATVSAWIREAEGRRRDDWFFVTSRYSGYERESQLESGFLELHTQPLDREQQAEFVQRWYTTVERSVLGDRDAGALALAAQRAAELIGVLRSEDFRSARLAWMTQNPLLLSILCVVHRKDVELPRRRAAIYEKSVAVLLESWRHEWRKEQDRSGIDVGLARMILEPLAWHMHVTEVRDATAKELEPVVAEALAGVSSRIAIERDPARFVEAMRQDSGLLVSAEPGRYAFLHLTFQEFLAASYAVSRGEAAVLASHFGDSWWNEAILLAAGIAEDPEFMEALLDALFSGDRWWRESELAGYLLDEALLLPAAPFVKHLTEDLGPTKLRQLLRQAPRVAAVAQAARGLTAHRDLALAVEAAELVEEVTGELIDVRSDQGAASASVLEVAARGSVDERTGVEFVSIPAGEFEMGGDAHGDEQPKRTVRVPAFALARTPVTNEQFERYLTAVGHGEPMFWGDRRFNRPDQPVVGVSWHDALAYCEWAGFRLPSEAEWEYACRAGTTDDYWSGPTEEHLARIGWYRKNSGGQLHAVAELDPNPWGLFDVHGNVWEWCRDQWHSSYEGAPSNGNAWEDTDGSSDRVLRGGSFGNSADYARSAFRGYAHPESRGVGLGFRPARDLP